jgi:hypothetical protein
VLFVVVKSRKNRRSWEEDKKQEQSALKEKSAHRFCFAGFRVAYIILKQNHCTPTCAIPSRPAAHSKVLTVLQQATSAREAGSTSIFAKAQVPDVVPRRMKNGEIPSEVPRLMIR